MKEKLRKIGYLTSQGASLDHWEEEKLGGLCATVEAHSLWSGPSFMCQPFSMVWIDSLMLDHLS